MARSSSLAFQGSLCGRLEWSWQSAAPRLRHLRIVSVDTPSRWASTPVGSVERAISARTAGVVRALAWIAGIRTSSAERAWCTGQSARRIPQSPNEPGPNNVPLPNKYHKLTGNPNKTKFISREVAYHGASLGALAVTGIPDLRAPFEPLVPGGCHVPNTNTFRPQRHIQPEDLDATIRDRILFEQPGRVAAVILEPVQNAGGCFVPPEGYWRRVREICDEFDVLLISDEVICAWGRLGEWFGAQRFDYQPDIITTAKGMTSAYAPMGAVIASDRIAEPFLSGSNAFLHGITFGGHPIAAAVALANIDVIEREGLLENVRAHEGAFRDMLESLRDIPIVGDVRGAGYFQAIELVKDHETNASFTHEEAETLLQGFLSTELFRRGLICRADDRGDPVIQLSPPLIAGPKQFAEMEAVLRPVLTEASERMHVH